MNIRGDDISINTFIGPGSAISGDIRGNGFVRIDGDIDGNFDTNGSVIIGEKARIRGNVTANIAIIGGTILGNVHAQESVQLLATSVVIGDVITKHLQVADKVVLHGHCISISEDSKFNSEKDKYLDEKSVKSKVIH